MPTQDSELLRYALIGYEQQKREIEEKIMQLRAQIGGGTSNQNGAAPKPQTGNEAPRKSAPVSGAKRKSTMSAEGRARIAEAQRKRWAAAKKASNSRPKAK